MTRFKIVTSVIIFSVLLSITSLIKNKTRLIEKEIYKVEKKIIQIEKDLHESELDFFYLSTPKSLSKKLKIIGLTDYKPMDFSRIYLRYEDFANSNIKISNMKSENETKTEKK